MTELDQEQERVGLFRQTLARVGAAWEAVQGGPDRLDMFTSASLEGLEATLNSAWLAAQQGLVSLDEFRKALTAWEIGQYNAIATLKEQ